jgi:NitT/TauT family transport system ATP-binding protein
MTADDLVRLEAVDKRYSQGTLALSGFSLGIRRHEFVSLVGPSGCGKSTVLRLIAGLGQPSAGTIAWGGGGKAKRDIGFVFQDPTLMPWATVADNVRLPLRLAGIEAAKAEPPVRDMLGKVGLDQFSRSYPRELSGGMRMRVSVARALVTRPSTLLMDEPFAALDEITRFELIEELLALWQDQPWTVVYVTHSVFESVYMSNRVVVVAARPGRVVAEIVIDEPFPRAPAFRGTARYADYCRQVSDALRASHRGPPP